MSKKELKIAIDNCFDYAPEGSPVNRLAILQEAQFYTRELERRSDSWVSLRDLILEVVVIALIGWEIHMGYRQESNQSVQFEQQKGILTNLGTSSAATASSLVAVKDTMDTMKVSLQKQVELFYDVQINVVYNEGTKKLVVINSGRSNVTIWSQRVGEAAEAIIDYPKPTGIPPQGTYEIPLEEEVSKIAAMLPSGQMHVFAFEFLVKNEKLEKFTVSGDLIASWHGDAISFTIPRITLVPGWDRK